MLIVLLATMIIPHDNCDNCAFSMSYILCHVPSLSQAKKLAVTTVSQILDASAHVFQQAAEIDNGNSFNM